MLHVFGGSSYRNRRASFGEKEAFESIDAGKIIRGHELSGRGSFVQSPPPTEKVFLVNDWLPYAPQPLLSANRDLGRKRCIYGRVKDADHSQ